jgi:hypothetical protein
MASSAIIAKLATVHIVPLMALNAGPRQLRAICHRARMATLTPQTVVAPSQAEPGLTVMIEYPEGPSVRIVAIRTIWAQSPLVTIVLAVTIDTGTHCNLKSPVEMTLFAGNDLVLPDQREIGKAVVEEDLFDPTACAVAGCAIGAKRAAMWVFRLVAVGASAPHRMREDILRMAIVASDGLVRTIKREFGVAIVRKADFGPLCVDVAGFALCPETVFMHILNTVASDTGQRQTLEHFARVTARAGHFHMCVRQREIGFRVIEDRHICPLGRFMALGTILAQIALVPVVLGVTIEAA